MAIGTANTCKSKLHFKNTLIGIQSSICLGNWILLLYLTHKDNHWESFVVLVYGITSSYILNFVFFGLYFRVMRKDEYYCKWREGRIWQERMLVAAALLTSF